MNDSLKAIQAIEEEAKRTVVRFNGQPPPSAIIRNLATRIYWLQLESERRSHVRVLCPNCATILSGPTP